MTDTPVLSEAAVLERLAAIVGARHVVTDPAAVAPHLVEWRGLYQGATRAVVMPKTPAEVAAILAFADANGLAIVPQGGNTGLVGGQIPSERGDEIVLSTRRLDRIREVDPTGDTITVEAGVTLAAAQAAATAVDRLLPLSLASEGSCTIGGNLATNAGGTLAIAYGNARDLVLGLEVVLADGRVLDGLGKLRKDNTGYDLKHLFIGSEGTLGVITAAVLKLVPRPRAHATALVGLADPAAAIALLERAKGAFGPTLVAFELMPWFGLELVVKHLAGTRLPIAGPHPWWVLMETASSEPVEATMVAMLDEAATAGEIADAVIAGSLDQRAALWRLREVMSDVQKLEGGSIKHDVSVPIATIPQVIAEGIAAAERVVPGIRPVPFGHLGDGNLHFNFSQPVGADKAAFIGHWAAVNAAVHAVVLAHGGSISAEHGIGRMKRHLLPEVKDPVALAVMRAIKATLDPHGILNPGKVL